MKICESFAFDNNNIHLYKKVRSQLFFFKIQYLCLILFKIGISVSVKTRFIYIHYQQDFQYLP